MAKCRVKMQDKIAPVEGSVKGVEGKRTGTCPVCDTPGVMLSIVGEYVRTHTVAATEIAANNPQPPTLIEAPVKYGKGLREPVTDLTDTGLRTGDPLAAERRRTTELHAVNGTGTVKIPVEGKTESGRKATKLTPVPVTEDNVRTALKYWRSRKPRSVKGQQTQRDTVADLYRMLRAMSDGQEAYDGTYDAASVARGPALVPGRSMTPRQRDPELPWSEPTDLRRNGQVRMSTTVDMPRGRDRFDRAITDVPEPPRKRTASERRRWRREQSLRAKLSGK